MITLDGTLGITTPSETNTGTLSVTGVTTLTGGLNAALPVLSGGTGVTTKTGTGAVVLGTSPTLATPTFDSAQLATISGTAPLYMCRAWVNFNGTGTVAIRASGNVSSITDNGTGDYTVNFTTAMVDINYSIVGSISPTYAANNSAFNINSSGTAASIGEIAPTVSACRIITTSPGPAALDAKYINISIFR
jgi:hypothetical protein